MPSGSASDLLDESEDRVEQYVDQYFDQCLFQTEYPAIRYAVAFVTRSTSGCGWRGGIQYDTVLPFDFDGDPATVLAECGQQVLDCINFDRERIYPSFRVKASAGAILYSSEKANVQFQADGQNLNNVLDEIDFGGPFQETRSGRREAICFV